MRVDPARATPLTKTGLSIARLRNSPGNVAVSSWPSAFHALTVAATILLAR
jgi:hypothetical protein